jgi:hypothetical protein
MVGGCGGGQSYVGAVGGRATVGNVPEFNPDYYNAHPEVARPWWWNWWSVQQQYPQNRTYWWWTNPRWTTSQSGFGPVDAYLYNLQRSGNVISQQAHDLAVLAIMSWNSGNALSADLRTINWTISMVNDTTATSQLNDLKAIVTTRLRQMGFVSP